MYLGELCTGPGLNKDIQLKLVIISMTYAYAICHMHNLVGTATGRSNKSSKEDTWLLTKHWIKPMQLGFFTLLLKSQHVCLYMCVHFLSVDVCACFYESACVCAHDVFVCACMHVYTSVFTSAFDSLVGGKMQNTHSLGWMSILFWNIQYAMRASLALSKSDSHQTQSWALKTSAFLSTGRIPVVGWFVA